MTSSNPALAKKIEEQIITARVGLLISQPFWGNLVTRLKLVDVTDDGWCETAATDGKNLYYNRDFVAKLNVKETQFLVGHEVGHCVFDHFGRRDDRDATLWNIAGDYVINDTLVDGKVGEMIKAVKPLYDTKYRGKCSEEVYDELFKNAKHIDLSKLTTLDQHLPMEGDDAAQGSSAGDKDDGDKDGTGMPTITKEQAKEIRDEFREAVLAAAQAAGAGNVPGSIKRLIKDFTEPKISWRDLIRQQIQSTVKSDFTWQRPNRKTWSAGVFLPGMNPEESIDVCICIDTSGSISDRMLKDFLGEIKSIMEQYRDFKIKVWSFDTEVYNAQDFDESNRDDILNYQPMGGGGTDFMSNYRWMRDNDVQPKKLIMFTDGYPFGAWGEPDYCDAVFIIHGTETIVPPFGTHAYYPKQ